MAAIDASLTGRYEPIGRTRWSVIRAHATSFLDVLSSIAIIGLTLGAIGTAWCSTGSAERHASVGQWERTFAFGVDGLPRRGSFL